MAFAWSIMPAYVKNLLPPSVVSRPLEGEAPTIDLAVGYSETNASPILKLFLSRMEELIGFATIPLHVPSGTAKRARARRRAGA
jgi:LysR family hca operon transcriptional activator